tara:strand:- start:42 stop:419 length:378 start_codon:yes stop_codon:yes gene_type:complete
MFKSIKILAICLLLNGCVTTTAVNNEEYIHYAIIRFVGMAGGQLELKLNSKERCETLAKQWTNDSQYVKCSLFPYDGLDPLTANGVLTDTISREKIKVRVRTLMMCDMFSNNFKTNNSYIQLECQ